jgi:hypothetical protein
VSNAARLGLFALVLGLVFVAALGLGSAIDPERGGNEPATLSPAHQDDDGRH